MKYLYKIIIGLTVGCVTTPVLALNLFADVPVEDEYFEAIYTLQQRGILQGVGNDNFAPDGNVLRSEAVKIILLAAGEKPRTKAVNKSFPDVETDAWYAPVVQKAAELKVVQGDAIGNFVPTRNVTRAEALAMLFRVDGHDIADTLDYAPFADVPSYAWFAPYFDKAQALGLIKGDNAYPETVLSRAELSDLVFRFYQHDWNASTLRGKASYYGGIFQGRLTANGEIFDTNQFTAAHKTLPFGTKLKVTNLATLESVVVRINDRGPYISGRVIDLSEAAFDAIADRGAGVLDVTMEIISESAPVGRMVQCGEINAIDYLDPNTYDNITLLRPVPTTFRHGEVFTLSGKFTGDQKPSKVVAIVGDVTEAKRFVGKMVGDVFYIPVYFDTLNATTLAIVTDVSSTAKLIPITLIKQECQAKVGQQPSQPDNLRWQIKNGAPELVWDSVGNDLYFVELQQGQDVQTYWVSGEAKLQVPLYTLKSWQSGLAYARVWGAQTGVSSWQRTTDWKASERLPFFATWHISRHQNQISPDLSPSFTRGQAFELRTDASGIEHQFYVWANGDTDRLPLNDGIGGFDPQTTEVHIVEILGTNGEALFVGGIAPRGAVPLIPDYFDRHPELFAYDDGTNTTARNTVMLRLINTERTRLGTGRVSLDQKLNDLAQYKADDMCRRNYVGHVDPDGKAVGDYRVIFDVQSGVGENIVTHRNLEAAHAALFRSPVHRANMVASHYELVGFGYCFPDSDPKVMHVVQVFGTIPFTIEQIPSIREQVIRAVNDVRIDDPVTPHVIHQGVAQDWAAKMAEDDFFGFENNGKNLANELKAAGISNSAKALLFQLNHTEEFTEQIDLPVMNIGGVNQNNILLDDEYQKVGIGIAQNAKWQIVMVVLATRD